MTALRRGREYPFACGGGLPHRQDCQRPCGRWHAPPRCLALALEDFNGAVPDVFPLEPVTFFRSKPPIKQDRHHVSKQERVCGPDGLLASDRGPDSFERPIKC